MIGRRRRLVGIVAAQCDHAAALFLKAKAMANTFTEKDCCSKGDTPPLCVTDANAVSVVVFFLKGHL